MSDVSDMTLKYGGRVIVATAVVNTNAPPHVVQKRLNRALRGDQLDAVICKIEGYSGDAGAVAWRAAQAVTTKVAAHPKVQSTDEPFVPSGAMDEIREIVQGMPAGALDIATVKDAIMALERTNDELMARGLSAAELAGLEIGAGVRLLRDAGATREKMLEACAMLWDGDIDVILPGQTATRSLLAAPLRQPRVVAAIGPVLLGRNGLEVARRRPALLHDRVERDRQVVDVGILDQHAIAGRVIGVEDEIAAHLLLDDDGAALALHCDFDLTCWQSTPSCGLGRNYRAPTIEHDVHASSTRAGQDAEDRHLVLLWRRDRLDLIVRFGHAVEYISLSPASRRMRCMATRIICDGCGKEADTAHRDQDASALNRDGRSRTVTCEVIGATSDSDVRKSTVRWDLCVDCFHRAVYAIAEVTPRSPLKEYERLLVTKVE